MTRFVGAEDGTPYRDDHSRTQGTNELANGVHRPV